MRSFIILAVLFTLNISDLAAQIYFPDPGWNGNSAPTHDTMPHGIGNRSRPSLFGRPTSAAFWVADANHGSMPYPKLSTTQMMAISSPDIGIGVYNTDSNKVCIYTGSWVCIGMGISSGEWLIGGNAGPASIGGLGTRDSYDLNFITKNIIRAKITALGNFGINIADPSALLHIGAGGFMFETDGLTGSQTHFDVNTGDELFNNSNLISTGITRIGSVNPSWIWPYYFDISSETGTLTIHANNLVNSQKIELGNNHLEWDKTDDLVIEVQNPLEYGYVSDGSYVSILPLPSTPTVLANSFMGTKPDSSGNIVYCETGFATYQDNSFTSGSPLIFTSATFKTIPNNGITQDETQIPCDLTDMYSATDTALPAAAGDFLVVTADFDVVLGTLFETNTDIQLVVGATILGGYMYHFYSDNHITANFSVPVTSAWASGVGAKIKLRTDNQINISNYKITVQRTHKAR